MRTQPGLARRAARRVQRHEVMDARVRFSSRGQLSDHPGRRRGHESKRVDDRAVAAIEIGHCNGWPSDHPCQRPHDAK
jgi:hypothetical protein